VILGRVFWNFKSVFEAEIVSVINRALDDIGYFYSLALYWKGILGPLNRQFVSLYVLALCQDRFRVQSLFAGLEAYFS
jgi:hypothetical protein